MKEQRVPAAGLIGSGVPVFEGGTWKDGEQSPLLPQPLPYRVLETPPLVSHKSFSSKLSVIK